MTEARWLDDRQQCAWRAYLRMRGQLEARLNRQLQEDCDLSLADYGVLARLSESPDGYLRPFELARDLQWEQSRLSHHLSRMQRRGLVERRECAEDGRGALVGITGAGRQAVSSAAPGHVEVVRRVFFGGLTDEQVTEVERFAAGVLARLDAEEEQGA